MTKLAVAIVAAAVGSAEAFGWHPAFHSRKPTSTDAEKAKAHLDTKTLATHGYDAHTLANVQKHGGLGMCQGDCDSDSHCRSGLKCYHSHKGGNIVTGCEGKTHLAHDYCYEENAHLDTKTLTTHGYQAHTLANVKKHGLGMCQGDCDSDSHCRSGLKCYHSHTGGNIVTGCEGKTHLAHDYCYEENAHLDTKTLTTHGYQAHTLANVKKHGLGMCQGDCDSDSHCRSGLKCYHSHKGGNTVTGCEGKTHLLHDYCYSPLKLSDPKRCQEWSCAEWCQFFDQAAEDAGVYKANGCGDDGMDTCACN